MTDKTLEDDTEVEGEDGEDSRPRKRWSGKRIVLLVVVPLFVLLGAGAGVWFSGILDSEDPAAVGEVAETPPEDAVFFDLPDLLVNLSTSGRRSSFLKIKISLEVASEEDIGRLESVLPRIIDNFQVYLRELRAEDLRGSAGLYRLREELLMRVQTAARPAVVRDVLFREMLVQ